MVDYLSEIPLPGRVLTPPDARGLKSASLGFVAGAENRLVAGAVDRLLAAAPTQAATATHRVAPKLLVLFGPSGTGKTHLAHGLVRHWHNERGAESALYLTASDFYRQLIDAIKRNSVVELRRSIRQHELLAIDDLHQLSGDDYVSQELRATLDSFEENGGTVIVASHRLATTLANISADVRSRLASGLMLQLAPPGNAARIRIIRRASESLGLPLSEEAVTRLAGGVLGTANDLFGAVFELCARLAGQPQNGAAHTEPVIKARRPQQPDLREIIAAVARYFELPRAQLKSHSRRQSIVTARAVAIYLARELTNTSYEQIGRAFGGRDHTTIMHSYRKIEQIRPRDPVIQEAIEKLTSVLLRH